MGSKSDFLELELLDHVLGNAAYSAPATVYVALYTAAPSDTGGGTEANYTGYARATVTNNATNWPAAAAGAKSNGANIDFPQNTGSNQDMTHFGILDAASGGNLLYWGALSGTVTVHTNDIPRFAVGDIDITED